MANVKPGRSSAPGSPKKRAGKPAGNMGFRCTFCGRKGRLKRDIRKHIWNVHHLNLGLPHKVGHLPKKIHTIKGLVGWHAFLGTAHRLKSSWTSRRSKCWWRAP
jgi:hypothetical protein